MLAAVVLAFLLTEWPREVVALAGAGVLMMSRRMHSRHMLSLVDWQLLVLFCGLFVVNHALETTGMVASAIDRLRDANVNIERPAWLFATTSVLSNLVSNVLGAEKAFPMVRSEWTALSFLPLSHVFERTAGHNFMVMKGVTIAYAESVEKAADNMLEVRPHMADRSEVGDEKRVRRPRFDLIEARPPLLHVDVGRRSRRQDVPAVDAHAGSVPDERQAACPIEVADVM